MYNSRPSQLGVNEADLRAVNRQPARSRQVFRRRQDPYARLGVHPLRLAKRNAIQKRDQSHRHKQPQRRQNQRAPGQAKKRLVPEQDRPRDQQAREDTGHRHTDGRGLHQRTCRERRHEKRPAERTPARQREGKPRHGERKREVPGADDEQEVERHDERRENDRPVDSRQVAGEPSRPLPQPPMKKKHRPRARQTQQRCARHEAACAHVYDRGVQEIGHRCGKKKPPLPRLGVPVRHGPCPLSLLKKTDSNKEAACARLHAQTPVCYFFLCF